MIYNDDCIKIMKTLKEKTIDMVFADPPYFLSNGGLSIHSGKVVSVNKGEWDKASNYEDVSKFNYKWLNECYRLLKDGGTIWVSGTQHNIFDVQEQMKKIGFKIINIIIWHKIDPPPLIYKNKFKFSYEFIIWASKGRNKTFNYNEMFKVVFGSCLKAVENKNHNHDIYKYFLNDMDLTYHSKTSDVRMVIDYIAGMTDDFLIHEYEQLKNNS